MFLFLGLAVAFGLGIYATLGADKAAEYFAGYLLEQSLSIDNLFVFVLIFDYFKTDSAGQDKASPRLIILKYPMLRFSTPCILKHKRVIFSCFAGPIAWAFKRTTPCEAYLLLCRLKLCNASWLIVAAMCRCSHTASGLLQCCA